MEGGFSAWLMVMVAKIYLPIKSFCNCFDRVFCLHLCTVFYYNHYCWIAHHCHSKHSLSSPLQVNDSEVAGEACPAVGCHLYPCQRVQHCLLPAHAAPLDPLVGKTLLGQGGREGGRGPCSLVTLYTHGRQIYCSIFQSTRNVFQICCNTFPFHNLSYIVQCCNVLYWPFMSISNVSKYALKYI